jgi:hypothetical protein
VVAHATCQWEPVGNKTSLQKFNEEIGKIILQQDFDSGGVRRCLSWPFAALRSGMNSSSDIGINPRSRKTARLEAGIQPVDVHVGQQIPILRIQMRLSQTELGKGIGLSYQQIQKYGAT